MRQPSQDLATRFEERLQDLPPETAQRAREFKAFTRARQVKTPGQWRRVVRLDCGLEKSLREVAGHVTRLVERLTETAVAERLAACRPWVRALRARMVPRPDWAMRSAPHRCLGIDASGIQAPGGRGTPYRLHRCMALVTVTCPSITLPAKRTGARWKHCPLGPGEVAVADRGYGHPAAMVQTVPRGADVRLRLHPHQGSWSQRDGAPLDLVAAVRPQAPAPICTLPGRMGQASQPDGLAAWVQASRLPAAQANRARQVGRKRTSKQGPHPKKRTLVLAGWVLGLTSWLPALLPGPTARAVYRVRWPIEVAMKRWHSVLDAELLRARAGSPLADVWRHGKRRDALLLDRRRRRTRGEGGHRLDGERLATWWRPWKLRQDELTPRMTGVQSWQHQLWPACVQVLVERPRRRTLPRLPLEVTRGLHGSNTLLQPPPKQDLAA